MGGAVRGGGGTGLEYGRLVDGGCWNWRLVSV